MNRLVDVLSDEGSEKLKFFSTEDAHLLGSVVDVLSFAANLPMGSIPAVKYACDAMDESLIKIEHARSFDCNDSLSVETSN